MDVCADVRRTKIEGLHSQMFIQNKNSPGQNPCLAPATNSRKVYRNTKPMHGIDLKQRAEFKFLTKAKTFRYLQS